jgi:hypothetical protein
MNSRRRDSSRHHTDFPTLGETFNRRRLALRSGVIAALLFSIGQAPHAQSLELPPRPATAPNGTEFARSIADLSLAERERKILEALKSGNVPNFLRKLVPVTVKSGTVNATYFVAPDYLAIGADEDYFLTPLSPYSAQAFADLLGCSLPTTQMVDDIYANATVKLTPAPIPPSSAMTTVPVFIQHNAMVLVQRKKESPGGLIAGHKKDVVIATKVFATPGKVAIYGWHKIDGKPIQPLYTGHTATWVDYSHGIRLVQRRMALNGESKTIDEVLADPRLAPLLSREGPMRECRYPIKDRGEVVESLRIDPGVRVVINRPSAVSSKPVLVIFFAIPNGNTIEQTIGKAMQPGDDWHFDIQHIGAQTRFLREMITDRTVVVAYLENDLKSWPAWRRENGDAKISSIFEAVVDRFKDARPRMVLTGHSGGGSLIFGFLNSVSRIPDQVERIAFLDANYAYESERHKDKLADWVKASDRHYLVVLAYHDAVALLNGKSFVSASGGTWGRSHAMVRDLEGAFSLAGDHNAEMRRFTALGGRIKFFLKENPERKVLHTVLVERNGFIESILSGTDLEGSGYVYFGDRAYSRYIRAD